MYLFGFSQGWDNDKPKFSILNPEHYLKVILVEKYILGIGEMSLPLDFDFLEIKCRLVFGDCEAYGSVSTPNYTGAQIT